jgi:hypothetical protein
LEAKGGALVIGSLYWYPKKGREEWWNKSVYKSGGVIVRIPTRYGRYSGDPWNCYTMVFSTSLRGNRLGSGYALPHRTITNNLQTLKKQAGEMGIAEGLKDSLTKNWGSVVMLLNPTSQFRDELEKDWKEIIGQNLVSHNLLKPFDGDSSPTNENGFLTIPWPTTLDNNHLENFDYLLATTTLPKHKESNSVHRYPTIEEIADEVVCEREDDYFKNNRYNKIRTFQDQEIRKCLNK